MLIYTGAYIVRILRNDEWKINVDLMFMGKPCIAKTPTNLSGAI